jgi:hypothetical protein
MANCNVGGANIQIVHYFDHGYLEEEKSMIHSFTVMFGAKYCRKCSSANQFAKDEVCYILKNVNKTTSATYIFISVFIALKIQKYHFCRLLKFNINVLPADIVSAKRKKTLAIKMMCFM